MAKVTCVECSTCGNMVWVGFSNGKIIEYNLQSGKKRKEYIGHKGAIKGIGAQSKSPSPHPHFTLNSPSSHPYLPLYLNFSAPSGHDLSRRRLNPLCLENQNWKISWKNDPSWNTGHFQISASDKLGCNRFGWLQYNCCRLYKCSTHCCSSFQWPQWKNNIIILETWFKMARLKFR